MTQNLLTESEVLITEKSQTETLPNWPSDSKANTEASGSRFSLSDRVFYGFLQFLQARNPSVGITGE